MGNDSRDPETSSSQTTEVGSRISSFTPRKTGDDIPDDTAIAHAKLEGPDLERGSSEYIIPNGRDGHEEKENDNGDPESENFNSAESASTPNLVTWDDDNDPSNPKNWSFKRKWAATIIGLKFH